MELSSLVPERAEPLVRCVNVACNIESEQEPLDPHSKGKGMWDSGCNKTVMGKLWLDDFLQHLSTIGVDSRSLTTHAENERFRFGNQGTLVSKFCVHLPCFIEGNIVILECSCAGQDSFVIGKGCDERIAHSF